MFTVHGDEMRSTVDAINMNYGHVRFIPLIGLRAHDPHPCVFIRLVPNAGKPVHHCAWIIRTHEMKGKKCKDAHNIQTIHWVCLWVCIHECTVVTWGLISPERGGANELPSHTVKATDVTRCIEHGSCRVEDADFAVVLGVVTFRSVKKIA